MCAARQTVRTIELFAQGRKAGGTDWFTESKLIDMHGTERTCAGEEVRAAGARGEAHRREDDAIDCHLRHGHGCTHGGTECGGVRADATDSNR
jgi:hypothetical protein